MMARAGTIEQVDQASTRAEAIVQVAEVSWAY